MREGIFCCLHHPVYVFSYGSVNYHSTQSKSQRLHIFPMSSHSDPIAFDSFHLLRHSSQTAHVQLHAKPTPTLWAFAFLEQIIPKYLHNILSLLKGHLDDVILSKIYRPNPIPLPLSRSICC